MTERFAALAAALALAGPAGAPARAADLSPARWPEAERLRLEAREALVMPAQARRIEGAKGLVAGTASPIAVHAGMEALRQGGSAADAAVATALMQVTDWLGANVSFAGVAQLVYYDARTRRVHAMDAGWNSWRGETSPQTLSEPDLSAIVGGESQSSGSNGRKTLVPGFMAGMEAMNRRFGRLRFAGLLAPSLWQAEHGVKLASHHAAWFGMGKAYLARTPEGRRFAFPDGSHLPAAGERFVQPELAAFLRDVARLGSRHMYRGEWARRFVAAVRSAGGRASLADMAGYKVRWTEPLRARFAGAEVHGPGDPNFSGCAMLAALNILDHRKGQKPYWQDAESFRTTALAIQAGQAAAFAAAAPAAHRAGGAAPGGGCKARLGPAFGAAAAAGLDGLAGGPVPEGHHSASVVAIDRWGNVAALVHSSNSPLWGEAGLVVQGVPIPTPAPIYRYALVNLRPGARVPTDMAPLIALRGGRPVLALASIGVSVVGESVRLAEALIRDGGDPAAPMSAPPMLLNIDPARAPGQVVPAGRYSAEWLAQARARGVLLREIEAQRAEALRGTAVIGQLGPDGRVTSVETPGIWSFAEAD